MLALVLAIALLPCSVFSGQSLIVETPIPGWGLYASDVGVAEYSPTPPYTIPTRSFPVSAVHPYVFDDAIGRVFVTNTHALALCPPGSAPAVYIPIAH